MSSVMLNRLLGFERDAKQAGDPWLFLEELGPLHAAWHSVPRTARTVGFLIFHWHAVQALKDLRLDRSLRVSPYSAEDFESGPFKEVGWTSWMSDVPDAVDLDGLVAYSEAIEAWHNEAHMTIGDVTGAPRRTDEIVSSLERAGARRRADRRR